MEIIKYITLLISYLNVEEDKMFKSKWFWIYAPLVFLMGIIAGDFETDGKTTFYAVFVGIGAGFSSLSIGVGLSGAIFSWVISAIFIIIWIFLIYKLYKHSKGEFKK